ncbi:fungal-specific transcription factor domain-containing protein [Talaromyces proteolyticus]|uniref:Fungal-specific transcription factor domain-containing protein n=1 Tax=Talaromyces proteolyticus TaxID=1131652 RepID=A0AAD4KM68_9EURO|nr:fungal-specific transcription factor domain-containing protein [Talaromyces proteolyticus]KAH8694981.1 fungal-specific transcription factor domain-containing protein [Talaromyces proteolyticus]
MTSPASNTGLDGLRPHSCVLCQKRKVKCDRTTPCSGCVKAQVECEYRDPVPPRRRKKKLPEAAMVARLRRYEDVIRKAGIDTSLLEEDSRGESLPIRQPISAESRLEYSSPPSFNAPISVPSGNTSKSGPGKFISREGRSLYLDNNLWKSVSNELQDAEGILPEGSTDSILGPNEHEVEDANGDFLFVGKPSRQSLTHLHPDPLQIFKLWQMFLDGVNPLTKFIHAPTLQQQILNATSDLSSISRPLEALMFAIYCAALLPMQDDEARKSFHESKSTLMARYRQAAQQALVNAGVLGTSDLMVLQAFLLFIISARLAYSPHVLWSMSGICIRIGQRIGLHRDGSKLGLSVFETEMRRRIWWRSMVTDTTIGHMAGCESFFSDTEDVKLPSNVNDSALDPDMTEPPVELAGATEMTFCLLGYEMGVWLLKNSKSKTSTFDGYWQFVNSSSVPLDQKDQLIDELETMLETRYVRYCDPSIPLHLVSRIVAGSVVTLARIRAHHPRRYQEKGEEVPQAERELLFKLCKHLVECANILFVTRKAQRFFWHIDFHFPWESIIVMLSELRHRSIGKDVAEGWVLVNTALQRQFKSLHQPRKNPLHLAVANLAIKAWSAHVAESERRRVPPVPQPEIITKFWIYTQGYKSSNPSRTTNDTAVHFTPATTPVKNKYSFPTGQRATPSDTVATASEGDTALQNNINNQSTGLSPTDWNYRTDSVNFDLDMSAITELYPTDDSPMNWVEWDDLIQQFQQQKDVDMDMDLPPSFG